MIDGILVLDKPPGFTSHDAVAKLRGILRQRGIGHGGTLDPMATGVLPILAGRATKASEYLLAADKEYVAAFRLGISTDTEDITGKVTGTGRSDYSEADVLSVLASFEGVQHQVPPMYSALRMNGVRLHELARLGIDTPREPRRIEIFRINYLSSPAPGEHMISVVCSKGTYIRTLCADIGKELGSCAAMSSLRRIRAGVFHIETAFGLPQIENAASEGLLSSLFLPVDSLFSQLPRVDAFGNGIARIKNGAFLDESAADPMPDRDGVLCRVYGGGDFMMIGRTGPLSRGGRAVFCVKNFF